MRRLGCLALIVILLLALLLLTHGFWVSFHVGHWRIGTWLLVDKSSTMARTGPGQMGRNTRRIPEELTVV
jgi:hypothetical protein